MKLCFQKTDVSRAMGDTGLCADEIGEEREADRSHRAGTREEGHSRRQKVQGMLEKPPGLRSQQCQALWQLCYIHELVGSSLILESGCDVPIFQMRKQRLQKWIQSRVPSHRTLHSLFAHQG